LGVGGGGGVERGRTGGILNARWMKKNRVIEDRDRRSLATNGGVSGGESGGGGGGAKREVAWGGGKCGGTKIKKNVV